MNTKIDPEQAKQTGSRVIEANGFPVLVDSEDYKRLNRYTWHIKVGRIHRYARRFVFGRKTRYSVYMHNQIMHCPRKNCVHHINNCGLDNRKANLEVMEILKHHRLHAPGAVS